MRLAGVQKDYGSKTVKICMLIWDYWPCQEGGSERQSRLVATRLAAKGIDCEIISSWFSYSLPRVQSDGRTLIRRFGFLCPVVTFVRRAFKYVQSAVRNSRRFSGVDDLATFERRQKVVEFWFMLPFVWISRLLFIIALGLYFAFRKPVYSVIHLHEPSWLGGVAVWLSRWSGSRVLCQEATSPALSVIGYDTPFRKVWGHLRLKADYIAMAPYIRTGLLAKGIKSDKIKDLPNGVVVPGEAADCARQKEVLYVGNFSQGAEWKAFDVLMQAWSLVHQRIPEAHITFVGGGDYSVWQEMARKDGCLESITFAGRTSAPGGFFSKAGMFVLPSRVEGLSNALLEAQSWGLPAVVSDIPGNIAVVENEVNGIVSITGNSRSLADAMLCLLSDDSLRKRLGEAARKKAEKCFNIDVVVDDLIKIYCKLEADA